MLRSLSAALLLVTLAAGSAVADDAKDKGGKKETKKEDSAVDAFFGTPPPAKGSNLDALKNAADGVAVSEKKGLTAKDAVVSDETKVTVHGAFAAEKIVTDKKLGCQPAKNMKKLSYFAFDEVPSEGIPLEVCVTLSSKAGREVALSVSIVDPRNSRVARADSTVDFSGRSTKVDHVIAFAPPFFKVAGPYTYLLEIDGKEVARVPLFDVKVE
ncbi:MAG TPA: hypothetical protein VGF99_16495 [Myxococcota bacterium]